MYYLFKDRPTKILDDKLVTTVNGKHYYSSMDSVYGYRRFDCYETLELAWKSIIDNCDDKIKQATDYKNEMIKRMNTDLNYEF